jgi:serine/threonine-protein kinase
MLVGRLPFIAEAPHAVLFKHIYEPPPSAHAARPEVPVELSDALQRAMAKEPSDRFATMEEFASAIWPERPVHAGQPTPTVPGFADLARMITSRRPRGALLMGVAAGVAVAALALTLMLGRTDRDAAPDDTAAMSAPGADSAAAPAPETQPDTQPRATAAVESTTGTSPKDTAVQVAPAAPPPPSVSADTATVPKATPPAQRKRPPARRPAPAATAPEPALPPAVQQVGFLTVNTVPYGSVSIDGVEVGDTPIVRRRLPPGEHTVKITRPGFRPESATVTITHDNEVRFSRTLIRDQK